MILGILGTAGWGVTCVPYWGRYLLLDECTQHFTNFHIKWEQCMLSHVRLFVTPWTVARQTPLPVGFSRQRYWRGVPLPTPGDLFDPGIQPESPASPAMARRFFTTSTTWEGLRILGPSQIKCLQNGGLSVMGGLVRHLRIKDPQLSLAGIPQMYSNPEAFKGRNTSQCLKC